MITDHKPTILELFQDGKTHNDNEIHRAVFRSGHWLSQKRTSAIIEELIKEGKLVVAEAREGILRYRLKPTEGEK